MGKPTGKYVVLSQDGNNTYHVSLDWKINHAKYFANVSKYP
jgi:hypothetical protein